MPPCGSHRLTFLQQDTSVIRDREVASGKAQACGRTAAGGVNDIATQLAGGRQLFPIHKCVLERSPTHAAADSAGLPSAAADGSVTMTVHQVNQDGAGYAPMSLNYSHHRLILVP